MNMREKMVARFLAALAVALALGALAFSRAQAAGLDQSQALFNQVLTTYVKDARVNYAALKAHPQALDRYLRQVAGVTEPEFNGWTRNPQLAFLINAYNAYTLRLILDHYPIKSIKDIGHFWRGPWDQPMVHLFGKTTTLNTLETQVRGYDEPRVHFALVCASIGCPPLRSEPYVASRLNAQLNDQAKRFLANRSKNRVDAADQTVYLSPIFKWYAKDFERTSSSVLAFLRPYWPATPPAGYEHFTIRNTAYDWSLNEQTK